MAKKKKVTIEQYEKFVRDYLVFEKRAKGISAVEPPKQMIEAMAKDMSENENFLNHTMKIVDIIWERLDEVSKTDEIKILYDELQKDIEVLK